jgi:hypothetical protein
MKNYCTLADFQRDELLREIITQDDIIGATEFVNDFAWSKDVDPIEIPNIEIPYKVKQLAISYAFMTAAQNQSIMNQKGIDGADAYELKRKVYAAKVEALKNEITVPVLLGHSTRESSFPTIRILRS